MANKQTEELGYYCGSLDHLEDDSFLSYADILTWSEWEVKRISMPKLIEYISKSSSIGEDYNDAIGFVGKSITIDKIKSSGHTTRGICFPNGISMCEKDISDSWIGYYEVTPSNYGFDSTTAIPANVCYGTFGMDTVYIQDLYVKNLHTSDSDSSDGDKTIQNLTVGKFIPSEITGFIDVDGNFCFNSNNESGTLSFENGGFKLSKDLTISGDSGSLSAGLVSTNELSPRNMNSDGEFLTYMYGGFSFVKNFPNQRYLVAGTDDNAVFNSNGGLTKVYSQSEIDTKIKSLEARIAALEAK